MITNRTVITERQRLTSPAPAPQALAWHEETLWIGSRDLRRIYQMEMKGWTVSAQTEAPGIPWAAVSTGEALWFTSGEGPDDDRYLRQYLHGFSTARRIPCPELTGSYLSYDGEHLYLSQWYKHRILKLDSDGGVLQIIPVEAEISGHVFVEGFIYVLRGTEQGKENWRIARLDPRKDKPRIEDIAHVPFQCRSLAFDGASFWTNHRVANTIVSFTLPE